MALEFDTVCADDYGACSDCEPTLPHLPFRIARLRFPTFPPVCTDRSAKIVAKVGVRITRLFKSGSPGAVTG